MTGSLEITPKTTIVNVNRNTINRNTTKAKAGQTDFEPPVRVSRGKRGKPVYGNAVAIMDERGVEVGRFIYDPTGALVACGARLVLVAHYGAKVVG